MRPLPELTPANDWFWTSGKDGQLRIQGCADCGALVHPPVPICQRCRSREREHSEALGRLSDDEVPAAERRIEDVEQEKRLRRAIDGLPEGQRKVLMLRYYGGLKYVEIAEALGCPLNTTLGHNHKAIVKLREILERT